MKSVLIIDDNEDLGRLYAEILEAEGYLVDYASSGEEALEKLYSITALNLILLDCNMPRMSGEDFVTQLRMRHPEIASRIPIVGLSSFRATDQLTEEFRNLTTAFVHKPDNIADFLEVVERFCHSENLDAPPATSSSSPSVEVRPTY